ncbi:MAG: LPP20 family lipoprotein [Gammaproteobacteria bacterium]|nr:LPP20 family lipoprotein [Gammaproteobacteria bacterium]
MNVMMKTGVALGLAALAGCASAPPEPVAPPDWVSGDAAGYPAGAFLLGRGSAGNLNDAIDRARADLAKGFAVEIRVETSDAQVYALDQPNPRAPGASEERMRLEVSRDIATRTDQIVRGVRIAETWRDPVGAVDHALAVLPRAAAMQSLQSEIRALDDAVTAAIARARAADDPLAAIAAADRALRAQLERDTLQRQLQVVDPSGHGLPARRSFAQLRSDRNALITRLRIRPGAAGDEMQAVAVTLAGSLGEAGFTVVEQGAADYTLAAVLELGDPVARDGWFWVMGNLEIVLGDPSGQVRGSHRWDIKTSAQDPNIARQRALDEIEAVLDRELLTTLLSFAGAD